jgi:hypothetical protein
MKSLALALVILFSLSGAAIGQTANGTWSQLSPSGPPDRWGHVMIYDARRDRLLIHGGWNGGAFYDDVWEYPLASNGPWHQLTPTGTAPAGRAFHSAIYDPIFDRMIVFGGYSGAALGDLWELDLGGVTPAWQAVATTGTPPTPRYWHSAVFNDRYQRMTLFAGQSGDTLFDDTVELDLTGTPSAWSPPVQPVGSPPPKRCCQEAVFISEFARMLVFGGWNGTTELGDLWELPYTVFPSPGWTSLLASGAIGARTDHVMALDRVRYRLVVDGGVTGPTRLDDVWELPLDGSPAWNALAPTGTAPAPRSDHAAVYDPVRDRLLVYGGFSGLSVYGDLWALTFGAGNAIEVDCSSDPLFTPGDTVRISLDIHQPFAAPSRFGVEVHDARGWPYASSQIDLGVFTPVVHLDLMAPVPDSAAVATNDFSIRVWDQATPTLMDSCTVHVTNITTPTLLSLVERHATADEVRLTWYSGVGSEELTLLRQEAGSSWRRIATLVADGGGHIAYVDRAVRPGARYGYRLADATGAVASEVWIDVPERPRLALHRAWYASRRLWLDVSLPSDGGGARLDLIDSSGRRVLSHALTAADERRRLSLSCDLPSGIYFANLVQGSRSARGKVLVLD